MRTVLILLFTALIFNGCKDGADDNYMFAPLDWKSREIALQGMDRYAQGKSYLPVYSHIYNIHGQRTFDLTITVSIRNRSLSDSVFILKADYYNTRGQNVRQYIRKPIYLSPLETLEIVIDERDMEGGSGANFVFDWAVADALNPPLFEAVMISTHGQQGLSFTTRGVEIRE